MIQGQSTGEAILAVFHGRRQLPKNVRQIIRLSFHGDDFCLCPGILECLLFLNRFKVMVGVTLQLKGLLNQLTRICFRGKNIGFDDQLPAVPVL